MKTPQALITAYENALASQSWEKVAPLIHEDCVATFSDGTFIGKTAVEAAFRKTFALIKEEQFAIRNVHWIRQTARSAVLVYNFAWSGIINGQQASGGGRGTSVLTNDAGHWQIICEHLGPPAR